MKEFLLLTLGLFSVAVLILNVIYSLRDFDPEALHNQVINPKEGIECVVVSASDSTSVDCWETL